MSKKLNLDLPLFAMRIQCNKCKTARTVDCRAWYNNRFGLSYFECPNCSLNDLTYHDIMGVQKVLQHSPLSTGEEDPDISVNYAIKFIKTGGWIKYYRFYGRSRWSYNNIQGQNYGDLFDLPIATTLSEARMFKKIRTVKSSITRFVNRSNGVLSKTDFEVYEIEAMPTKKVVL